MILVSSCCVMFLHRNHEHLSRRSPSLTMRFHKCVKAVYNRSAVLHAVFCRTHRHRHRHRHRLCGVRCSVCEEPAWALCSASGIKGLRLGAWAWGLGLMVLHMDGLGAAHAASVHSGLSLLSFFTQTDAAFLATARAEGWEDGTTACSVLTGFGM